MRYNTKILVIDDDEGILDGFQAILESEGYEVQTSADSDIILRLDDKTLPDIIFLDVLLSGKDGRELCKQLKQNPLTAKIPIIMTSAHPNIRESVIQSGAEEYLQKPFEMDHLLNLVKIYSSQ